MASKLVVNELEHTSGSGTAVSIPKISISNTGSKFPSGHIIQSKFYSWSNIDSTSSTSWDNKHDEMIATITPEYATSSIYIFCHIPVYNGSGYALCDFYKNASDFTETYNSSGELSGRALAFSSNANDHWTTVSYAWLDPLTENSVTEKTYAVSFRCNAGSVSVGNDDCASIMALWEIAV